MVASAPEIVASLLFLKKNNREMICRFFNTTGDILNIEQPDDFPLNCNVRINEASVNLPVSIGASI